MSTPDLVSVNRQTAFSRLDFRAKLAVFLTATLAAILWNDPWLNLLLAAAVAVGCAGVGIPPAYLRLIAKVMMPFFLILLLTHGFFNVQHVQRLVGGRELTTLFNLPDGWWGVGGSRFSREGGLFGLNAIAKSLTFMLMVPLCVFTTDPNHLVVSLVRLRVPYKLAFVVTSTLRFFPLLFDEIQAVIRAQRLRGFAVEELSVIRRVRVYAKVAVPVILGALHKAQETEVVLQTRGFSGQADRTYLHAHNLTGADWSVIILSLTALTGAVAVTMVGWADFQG